MAYCAGGYHCTMLELTELLKATNSFTNICRWSLHVAMEGIETPEFNDLDR